jgi:hypothetical protein
MPVYIHKGCFDGVTSGALVTWFLRERHGATRPDIVPVDYGEAGEWLNQPLPENASVADFLYHPTATYWWDHHGNPFRHESWREKYERQASPFIQWDSSAKSCAGLILRALSTAAYDAPDHLQRTAGWADLIDSASYPTAEDAVFRLSVARQLALSLRVCTTAEYHTALVYALADLDVGDVVRLSPFSEMAATAVTGYAAGVERMRKVSRLEGNTVVYSLDENGPFSDRMVPFFLFRDAGYSLGILHNSQQSKVTANANPWRPPQALDIGGIFTLYGGGGHHDVGSVILKGAEAARADAVLKGVLAILHGSMH